MKQTVRTRFAPSPTGFLHVGSIRTALFAWLLARQHNGQFVLRLEDTDKKREVEGAREHLMQSLRALDLQYDEGPDIGGPYGPYTQSERLESYKTWALKLIESGRAYADPYSPEQIQAFREQAQREKRPFLYRNHRPDSTPEWDGSRPLRFRSDPKTYRWDDAVMGELQSGPEVIDDFVLLKSDGYPTYNFAHIIDDAEMAITHIIRGQEFIASQPNYLNLYEALHIERPVIATVPHILNETGNKKLGKRDGAKDVLDYIREGYLPEALVNFIASLGWNDGTEQELFTRHDLIEKFSLDRVQRSGARFDERRLLWMNGAWIRQTTLDELAKLAESYWPQAAQKYDHTYRQSVLGIVQERLKYLAELPELTSYFFDEPEPDTQLIDTHKQLSKYTHRDLANILQQSTDALQVDTEWMVDTLQRTLNTLLETTNQKPVVLFSIIRLSLTWAPSSPGLADTLQVLGRERSLKRINQAISLLQA